MWLFIIKHATQDQPGRSTGILPASHPATHRTVRYLICTPKTYNPAASVAIAEAATAAAAAAGPGAVAERLQSALPGSNGTGFSVAGANWWPRSDNLIESRFHSVSDLRNDRSIRTGPCRRGEMRENEISHPY